MTVPATSATSSHRCGSAANDGLTPDRVGAPQERTRRDGEPVAENAAYAAMLRRMFRSYERRLAAGDVEDLAAAVELRDELDRAIDAAVAAGRVSDPEGWSWSRIGRVLGISRQAAQQRWGA